MGRPEWGGYFDSEWYGLVAWKRSYINGYINGLPFAIFRWSCLPGHLVGVRDCVPLWLDRSNTSQEGIDLTK